MRNLFSNTRHPKASKKAALRQIFTRYMLIVAIFILWAGGITVRLIHLQVNQSEWLRAKAQNQRRDIKKSKQFRGTIFDRSERVLAMSVNAKSLYADPTEIENLEAAANQIAEVLDLKAKDVLNNLRTAKNNNKRFVPLARKLDQATFDRVNERLNDEYLRKYDLPRFAGLHWREEHLRSYPYQSLASHVVGFTNYDDVGSIGIEQSQEEFLRGVVVSRWQDRDRLGRVYEKEEIKPDPPKNVILTISTSIQYKVERALENGVKIAKAKSGTAILLDPKTGEILALANYPTFDPNLYTEADPKNFSNNAIQSIYAPGSVFNSFVFGGALEEKLISPGGVIDGRKGFIQVGVRRFEDPNSAKLMTYTEALAISSNYAPIKIGFALGDDKFYDYANKFGFGKITGIELPAEQSGILRPPDKWNADSLASMSIGYELAVTALQMAAAYGAIANDGIRVQPHIIREIRKPDGEIIPTAKPETTLVLSPETARQLRVMLRQVIAEGTATNARLDGYSSAGKTGTAWKYDPQIKRFNEKKYISSFVGFAPADTPSIVIAIVIDEPYGEERSGGQVAASIFKEIAEQVLPELNIIAAANNKD